MPTHQPPEPADARTNPLAELAAMRKIVAVLTPLDGDAQLRVVSWISGRYGPGTDFFAAPEVSR